MRCEMLHWALKTVMNTTLVTNITEDVVIFWHFHALLPMPKTFAYYLQFTRHWLLRKRNGSKGCKAGVCWREGGNECLKLTFLKHQDPKRKIPCCPNYGIGIVAIPEKRVKSAVTLIYFWSVSQSLANWRLLCFWWFSSTHPAFNGEIAKIRKELRIVEENQHLNEDTLAASGWTMGVCCHPNLRALHMYEIPRFATAQYQLEQRKGLRSIYRQMSEDDNVQIQAEPKSGPATCPLS